MRGQPHDVLEIVGDEDQRHVEGPAQPVDLVLETAPDLPIDGGKRLVEQQHVRLARQRPRQRHSLTFAPGQLVRPPGRLPGQVHQGQQRVRAGWAFGARTMSERGHHVPRRRQVREQRVLLEDEPHRPAMRRRECARDGVRPDRAARSHGGLRRPGESRNRAQDGGLAAAGRAEDGQHVAGITGELDVEGNRAWLTKGDRQPALRHGEDLRDATTLSWP